MRVFLCEPNIPVNASRFEPLGLCTISGYLKAKGHGSVVYQQFSQTDEEVAAEILRFEPDVVGFSCIDVNARGALHIAALIREKKPDIFIVFGGEHPTANTDLLLKPQVDLIVRGEGEITLLEILEQLQAGSKDFSQINGLAYLDPDGRVALSGERDRIDDLGSLPLPDRDILGKAQYQYYGLTPTSLGFPIHKLQVASSYLSRGCTYNCRFCTTPRVWGRRWIARPVDDVVREVKQLAESGINFIYFQDENFLTSLSIVRELCEKIIALKTGIYFSIISRVTHLDEETTALLYQAGCRHIGVGIESVREETLSGIQKDLDLETTRDKIAMIRRHGISICGLFMIGYPWETEEQILSYGPLIRSLGVDSLKVQFLTPFAGTPLYEEALEKGQIITEDPFDHSTETPVLKNPNITPERLAELRTKLYRDFFIRPGFILKIVLQSLRHPSLIPYYLNRFYWFMRIKTKG